MLAMSQPSGPRVLSGGEEPNGDLTPQERDWAIRRCLACYENNWAQEMLRDSEDMGTQLAVARRFLGNLGVLETDYSLASGPRGLLVGTKDGRIGLIVWREVIQHAQEPDDDLFVDLVVLIRDGDLSPKEALASLSAREQISVARMAGRMRRIARREALLDLMMSLSDRALGIAPGPGTTAG